MNEILQVIEDNKYTLGVFLDLSKAVDTIGHKIILLQKLEHINMVFVPLCYHGSIVTYLAGSIMFCLIKRSLL